MKKTILLTFLFLIVLSVGVFAEWYNPFSWFDGGISPQGKEVQSNGGGFLIDSDGNLIDENNKNIVRDSNGNLYIAYTQNGVSVTFANSSDDGITWSTQTLITDGTGIKYANMIIDSNNNLFILFQNQSGTNSIGGLNSTDNGKTWIGFKAFEKPSDTTNIDCAIDSNEIIHCCSTTADSGGFGLGYYHNSSPWNTSVVVNDNSTDDTLECDLEVNEDNCPFIIGAGLDEDDIDIWSPCLDGWGDQNRISIRESSSAFMGSFDIHNNTRMYATWYEDSDLWFGNSSDGGVSWSNKEIDSDRTRFPVIATRTNGDIYIMSVTLEATTDLFYAFSTDNGLNWDIRNQVPISFLYSEYVSIQDSMYPTFNRFDETLRVAVSNKTGSGGTLYYWNLSLVEADAISVSVTDSIGYGYNVSINATITESGTINSSWVEITYPNSTSVNYTMTNIGSDIYQYNFTDTWNFGQHNITAYYNDSSSNVLSDSENFTINISATINVKTMSDSYNVGDVVNLTDPPNFGFIGDELIEFKSIEPDSVRYIIEFEELPLLKYKKTVKKESEKSLKVKVLGYFFGDKILENDIENRIDKHTESISKEHDNLLKQINKKPIYEYKTTMNGVVLNLTKQEVEEIRNLPYVKKVTKEGFHNITMNTAKGIMDVEEVWKQVNSSGFNITGKGIRVAVMDTGIDYTHRFFGNCSLTNLTSGNCERIEYGYDFYNNDNDPFDDYGHGTHVSGIIGGYDPNNVYTGVAYNVTFLEYKVCSSGGSCPDGALISAIENATNKEVDIIHMSLGAQVDIDDETIAPSLKIAYDSGIMIVASAGNDGPNYDTMNCPSCLSYIIAVGSTTKSDTISYFSSRGYAYYNNGTVESIKPDILAPGSSITSSVPTGVCSMCDSDGIASASGTSMSAPQVSGILSLLIQAHPDWNQDELKSALMNNAEDLGYDALTQGSGRANALDSYNSSAAVIPHNFFAGANINLSENFSKSTIFNLSGLQRNVTFNISYESTGFHIAVNLTNITSNTSSPSLFLVNITRNNTNVTWDTEYGTIFLNTASESYRIPIVLLNSLVTIGEGCPSPNGELISSNRTMSFNLTCIYLKVPENTGLFIINNDNITLDCNGSTLIGDSDAVYDGGRAVYNNNYNRFTVQNCTFRDFRTSIYQYGDNGIIKNNVFDYATFFIFLFESKNARIYDNMFKNGAYYGVYYLRSDDSLIYNNNFTDNFFATFGEGLTTDDNNNISIYDNVVGDAPYGFHTGSTNGVKIYRNNFSSILFGNSYPMYIMDNKNALVEDNIIKGDRGMTMNGMTIWQGANTGNIFRNNIVNVTAYGIWGSGPMITDAKFYNMTIIVNSSPSIYLINGPTIYLINVTINTSIADIDNTSTYYKLWYANVNVINSSDGTPLSDVNVTSYNNCSGSWVLEDNGVTGSDGKRQTEFYEFKQTGNITTYCDANITVTKDRYFSNSTIIRNISDNIVINLTMLYGKADTTNPIITVLSPTSDEIKTDTTVVFNITTNEDCDVALYSLNGTANVTMNKTSTTVFYKNLSLSDNEKYYVIFYVNDTSGNWGNSSNITFTVNTSYALPENKSMINITANTNSFFGHLTLKIQKNISGIWTDYETVVDNDWIFVSGTTALDTLWWADGAYTANASGTFRVLAEVKSPSGNLLKANSIDYLNATYEFTVGDVNAPIVTINTPTVSFITNNVNVTLNYTVTDLTDTSLDCWYHLDLGTNASPNNPISNGTDDRIILVNLTESTHNLSVTCQDSLPQNTTTSLRYFTIDLTPPDITLVTPLNGTSIHISSSTSFDINITETNEVSNCTLFYRSDTELPYNSFLMSYSPATEDCTSSLDMTQYSSGDIISFYYQVYDTASNIGYSASDDNPYTLTLSETNYPTFSNNRTNASLTTYNGTDVQINLTISDDIGIAFYRLATTDTSGGIWENESLVNFDGVGNVSMVWNYSIQNFPLVGGTFSWRVWANDTSGNVNISSIYTFQVQSSDFSSPSYSNFQNNASTLTKINGVINWSIDLSDIGILNHYFFAHNQSGNLTNVSNGTLSGQTDFINYSLTVTLPRDNYVCGQFWFNDTSGNVNQTLLTDSGSCFTVANTAPTQSTPIINSSLSTNLTSETLQCFNVSTSDADSDLVTNSYRWFEDTVLISGETTSTLANTNTEKDKDYICEIAITDGIDSGISENSTSLTILNTAPSVPTVTSPNDGEISNVINIEFNSSDIDGDTISYTIYINNTLNITTNINISDWNGANGYYSLTITANDTSFSANSSVIYFTLDTSSPAFSNNRTNASLTTYNGSTVQINLTIKDVSNISAYTLTTTDTVGRTWANETIINLDKLGNVTMVWNHTISNFPLVGGTMSWKVWANDTLGNTGVSSTYTFLVMNSTPAMIPDNYLDFYDMWVNELIGDVWLFVFLGLIMIWFLAAKSKLTTEVSMLFAILFLAAIFAKTGLTILWVFTVLGVGAIFYYKISKIIRQG